MNNGLVIVGAGAHARKTWHYATSLGLQVTAFVDDNPQAVSPSPSIPCLSVRAASCFGSGQHFVVAIGNAAVRQRLQEEFEGRGWLPMTVIHPTAYVAPDSAIGAGCVICVHAVVETGSVIGVGTIIDVGSVVGHDCVVGAYYHFKAGCLLQSYTSVGDGKILSVWSDLV